jgi:hypothetical protein
VAGDRMLLGAAVRDASGADLGQVTSLLVDPGSDAPRWLEVTDANGGRHVLPARSASVGADDRLTVPWTRDVVVAAPAVAGAAVSAADARALLAHYGYPDADG